MAEGDEYKDIIKQCMGSVKEVFGDGKFDDVIASIIKMQERVLASTMKEEEGVNHSGRSITDETRSGANDAVLQEIMESLKIIKKRILRLERKVFDAGSSAAGGASSSDVS